MIKKKLLTDRSGTLYDQMIDNAVQRLADDIDFEVLISAFLESGWSKVVLKPMTWEHGTEVDSWVEQNIKGQFHTRGLVWVFKESKEANWFKLRWLG